ncbi:MAG: hypothetical protein RSE18_00225 [Acinetobacter sp.]
MTAQEQSQSQLPDYLKQYMDQGGSSADANSMAEVKVSVPRVSLKAKRFKFINGEEESKGTDSIHVAILAVEPPGQLMNKVFYKGGYNPTDTAPPDCASSNGIAPDAWVSDPQADTCAKCPNNMFGSAISPAGKKSKACKDSKVLWVAKPDDIEGIVYGLKVPVTSLKAMGEYGKLVKSLGVPLAAIVTELSMDQDNEYPLLEFKQVGFLNQTEGVKAIGRSTQREWIQESAPMLEHGSAKDNGAQKIEHKKQESVTIEHVEGEVSENQSFNEIAQKW